MTLILNILHIDFSVLLADKRAQTKGTVTIKAGTQTIIVNPAPGVTVNLEGFFSKIALNKTSSLAVGVAGTIGNHKYLEQVKSQVGIEESLAQIVNAVTSKGLPDRSIFKVKTTFSQDQGIAAFFDPALSTYFTLTYNFCEAATGTRWYSPNASQSIVFCCGSGANHFVAAVGQGAIDEFLSSFTGRPPRLVQERIRKGKCCRYGCWQGICGVHIDENESRLSAIGPHLSYWHLRYHNGFGFALAESSSIAG